MSKLILFTADQYAAWLETREKVHRSLKALSNVCDGAQQRDAAGFNGADTIFGHDLAKKKLEWLTVGQVNVALKMLQKYAKQIERLTGIRIKELPKMPPLSIGTMVASRTAFNGIEERMRWWGPGSQRVPIPEPPLRFHTLDIL